jgi:hypothetical protein
MLTTRGRRGVNAVAFRFGDPSPGRYVAAVRHDRGFLSGCPVVSRPLVVR